MLLWTFLHSELVLGCKTITEINKKWPLQEWDTPLVLPLRPLQIQLEALIFVGRLGSLVFQVTGSSPLFQRELPGVLSPQFTGLGDIPIISLYLSCSLSTHLWEPQISTLRSHFRGQEKDRSDLKSLSISCFAKNSLMQRIIETDFGKSRDWKQKRAKHRLISQKIIHCWELPRPPWPILLIWCSSVLSYSLSRIFCVPLVCCDCSGKTKSYHPRDSVNIFYVEIIFCTQLSWKNISGISQHWFWLIDV